MKEKLKFNPWLNIWVHPRTTIRAITQTNKNYRLLLLSTIYGFQLMLQSIQYFSLGQGNSLALILLFAIIFSIPVGYITFNVWSFFYYWLGKLIKGKGSFKEVRTATVWSSVPIVVVPCLSWIILMIFHGNSLFTLGYETQLTEGAAILTGALGIIQFASWIWGLVILLHALGEVQGFSAWLGLLNVVLAGLVMFILLFLIGWGVSALIHVS